LEERISLSLATYVATTSTIKRDRPNETKYATGGREGSSERTSTRLARGGPPAACWHTAREFFLRALGAPLEEKPARAAPDGGVRGLRDHCGLARWGPLDHGQRRRRRAGRQYQRVAPPAAVHGTRRLLRRLARRYVISGLLQKRRGWPIPRGGAHGRCGRKMRARAPIGTKMRPLSRILCLV